MEPTQLTTLTIKGQTGSGPEPDPPGEPDQSLIEPGTKRPSEMCTGPSAQATRCITITARRDPTGMIGVTR